MEFRVKSWMTALALFLVQITFVPLISVGGFTPDLLIPWLLYVGIRQGQMEATLSGFAIGLVQDSPTALEADPARTDPPAQPSKAQPYLLR